jgi:hypothetical protein
MSDCVDNGKGVCQQCNISADSRVFKVIRLHTLPTALTAWRQSAVLEREMDEWQGVGVGEWLTEWREQRPSLEFSSSSASYIILRLLWSRKFITVFTTACHLPFRKPYQSSPSSLSHSISLRSILPPHSPSPHPQLFLVVSFVFTHEHTYTSAFSTMCATCPTQSRQRPWFHHHMLQIANHVSPHYAVFSSLPLILPSIPLHPTLEHPQPVRFSKQERPTVTSLQDNRHSDTAVLLYRHVVKQNAARQQTPDRTIASRPSIQWVTIFFIPSVLIWWCLSQIFHFAPFQSSYLLSSDSDWVLRSVDQSRTRLTFSAFTSRPAVR